jgi:isopenicillin-N N-acyltransferase like protein
MARRATKNPLKCNIFLLPIISVVLFSALYLSPAISAAGATDATTRPANDNYIPIFELRGDPKAIGTEHGKQLGETIQMLYKNYLLATVSGSQLVAARISAAVFQTQMLPEHREEVAALAQSAKLNPLDTALAQCFLDLLPGIGCSTIALPAEASPDGIARFGRNLDFESLNLADKHTVVLIYHPKDRYQFAAVGWPGMIGVLSGMNEHGLALSNMEVPRQPRLPQAMPYTLLYRSVLEQCRDVDEAIAFLNKTPRQTANNLMLMDAGGKRAVAEITPEGVTVRWGATGAALISTNHQRGNDNDTAGFCWRYDSLHAASAERFGKIDSHILEWMLSRVVQGDHGDMTLQSMVFEPSNRIIYLAAGADAPSHTYQRIDLKNYFDK